MDLKKVIAEMSAMKPNRLQALVSVKSLMEDLNIAETSAVTILSIKEDLIGPARQRTVTVISLSDMIADTVANMGLPDYVVEMEWAGDMPKTLGDARQVEQVFNNLIKNSWEALSQTPSPKITVKGRRDNNPDFVLVTVKDNGPGIPKEIQEKIWVSFFTTKGGSGGTGLGLSSVMQIVNQHGGSISLESEAGQGALFSVRLPVAR
jgi:signal transduction histidine kinase